MIYGKQLALYNDFMSGWNPTLKDIRYRYVYGPDRYMYETKKLLTSVQEHASLQGTPIDYIEGVNIYGWFPPGHEYHDTANIYYLEHWTRTNHKAEINMEGRFRAGYMGPGNLILVKTRIADTKELVRNLKENGLADRIPLSI